jgi:hypothetical protein
MNKKNTILAVAVAGALTIFAGGCANDCCNEKHAKAGGYEDPFFPRQYSRIHDLAAYQQSATAARADATLFDMHFHGGRLNSLGEDKLALMFDDDDQTSAIVVYLDTAVEGAEYSARVEAVRAFASSEGVDGESIRFERGSNPASRTLVAPLQRNLPKTDSKSEDSNGGGAAGMN